MHIYVYLVLQKNSKFSKRKNRPNSKEMQENGLDQEHFKRIKRKSMEIMYRIQQCFGNSKNVFSR